MRLRLRFVLLALVWAALILASCRGTGTAGRGAVALSASVAFTDRHLIIRNADAYVWRQATVTLDGRFVHHEEWVPRGSIAIAFDEFVDARGERFRPRAGAGIRVRIEVPDADGGKPGRFEW